MKKSLIALAVLAASGAAMAQSSVNVFGIVDTGVGYVKNSGGDKNYGLTTSGNATSRLGFRGVEDLGGGLKAGFWLEGQIDGDDGNAAGFNFKRRSTVSLIGNFGEVRLGRDLTAGYNKTSSYDVFGQVGMGQFLGWSSKLYGGTFAGDGIRADNLLAYFTPKVGGFSGGLNYGFGENVNGNKFNRYVGAFAAYDNGPLSIGLAGDKNNIAVTAVAGPPAVAARNLDRTQFSVGASYNFGVVKVGGLYQNVKLENVLTNVEQKWNNYALNAVLPVGSGEFKAQFASYDRKNSNSDVQQLSLGYVHNLSKRTALYGTAAFLKNKNGATAALGGNGLALGAVAGKNQTGFQTGIRHNF